MTFKQAVRALTQICSIPIIPFLAIGYWAFSDENTYLESIKKVWEA